MPEHARTPRIAIVRHGRYPFENHLSRDVSALRDAGFTVDVICDGEPGRPAVERIDGVTVLRMPITHRRSSIFRYVLEYTGFPLLSALTVAARSLWRRYDYVEIRNMPDWLIIAAVIPKLLGATIILYTYENMPELAATDHNLAASHPLVRTLLAVERACASVADCLIAPSEMIRRILINQGIPEEKIAVVPNVPDERVFLSQVANREPVFARSLPRGDGGAPRTDRDPQDGVFRVVTHGSLLERYGIQTLLDAMDLLRGHIPGLHLEILGEGEYRAQLEAQARRLDLQECVTFAGSVPFDRVAPRLLQADVGVVPMWADLVPNKLMEYLALGLPAITTEAPGVRLYFDDSAVCYVERRNARALADAIMDLYRNPDRRFALAATGYAVFRERFAWERTRSDYLSIHGTGLRRDTVAARGSGPGPQSGPPRIDRHMKWLPFVLGESRGPRNALTRLPTIIDRFGLTPHKSIARLERLLEVTGRYGVHPTLLVTAMVAKRHPAIVHWLMDRGVEVAAHGYVHNDYASLSRDEQIQQVQHARQELAALGVVPRGWRCPYSRWNAETMPALLANGVDYDATPAYAWPAFEDEHIHLPMVAARAYARLRALYKARDARHQAVLPTMIDTLVQIPMLIPQDEDMVDRLHLNADAIARVWLRILHDTRDHGETFVINLHPERTFLCAEPLDKTLSEARRLGDVWIVTLGEIADWWRERDRACLTVEAQGEGSWRIDTHGPDRLMTACAGQTIAGPGSLLVDSVRKPVIHCGPAWPGTTRRRLREAGYPVEQGDGATSGSGYALDLDPLLAADASPDAVIRFVRERDENLARINPWPAGYRSCLSITGDIDAFTLIDFALRLKEF